MKGGLPHNFGQLESMHDSATGETTYYQYDLFGNLLRVDLPDGRAIEYDVDGAGRRVGRRELDADGFETSFRGWIYRDLLRPIAEVDRDGNVVARYIYRDGSGARQNGLKQLNTRVGVSQHVRLPFSGSNVPEAIHLLDDQGSVTQRLVLATDHVGSVRLVVDEASGVVLQSVEYDAFGRVVADSSPGLQPFGFGGGFSETELQMVRLGARDYFADVGRWGSRDAIRFADGPGLYLYVDNDPVNNGDPTGLIGLWDRMKCCFRALGRCSKSSVGPKEWYDDQPSPKERERKNQVCRAYSDCCTKGNPPPNEDEDTCYDDNFDGKCDGDDDDDDTPTTGTCEEPLSNSAPHFSE